MGSVFGWIDHDAKTREYTRHLLSIFKEEESRDELGLGAIRDSISDLLFPGTSTIQTRLKYMLFVPWIYMILEEKRIPSPKFGEKADEMERDLIEVILKSDDTDGAFGKVSGRDIKRLPSSVYWSGLESWRIRQIKMSRQQYHERIDDIYESYDKAADDEEQASLCSWHQGIPPAPETFPERAEFSLTTKEALFLRDRIVETHPDSLLAFLAEKRTGVDLDSLEFVWNYPYYDSFSEKNKNELYHARNFSEMMYGAVIGYNYFLSVYRFEKKRYEDDETLVEEYKDKFSEWFGEIERDRLESWKLNEFWELLEKSEYKITSHTKEFVETWKRFVLENNDVDSLLENEETSRLIKNRERKLKRGKARFDNEKALEQWGGRSGLAQLDYRWRNVKVLLRDLYEALPGGDDAGS